ncbi:glutathione S-transferase family protein [Reinekea sp. G2M2-21]|uniref:glutathione S-transferase family protein n=1 Tax=Reinekea sp. G2M2-21 TaxID=2788942 RepID=UPI0018AC4030|nr:glutathione S-transferase family protein [Reinekea sp. G2M2-21]
MGLLVDGQWTDKWYDTKASGGKFIRSEAQFRHWVTPDGSAGSTGNAGFKAESGRYHLYVSLACPWAHRTLIMRQLKQLTEHVSVSVVHSDMLEEGWMFIGPEIDSHALVKDHLYNSRCYHELYTRADPHYSGRVTVPVLWDKQQETIVSNESADIILMMNSAFNGLTGNTDDYYPIELRSEIDAVNERVYHTVNNGVYKTGFATTQEAYDEAFNELFESLDWLEDRLSRQQFLVGSQVTVADWRLFTTLVRFDAVYFGHFKCNAKRIVDYPNLSNYVRALYQWPAVADTVDFTHIKRHYYFSHRTINPTGVIPKGPIQDLSLPHDRSRFQKV